VVTDTLPFAGVASFLKAPCIVEPSKADGEVAVVGIPWDGGTTSRPGARYGPRALRDVSTFWAYRDREEPFFDGEAGAQILAGVRFVDTGDIDLAPTAPAEVTHPLIAGRVAQLLASGLFVVVLGGDHSITYPVLQGYAAARGGGAPEPGSDGARERGAASSPPGARPLHLVQFDTHMDYWDSEGGMRTTHASPIVRSHEDGLVQRITQYGIRGLHTASDQIELARGRGVTTFWAEAAKRTPVEELVAHIEPGEDVYLTFDIDALDPSIAPGTGTPEPGGFTYYEAKAILRAVAQRAHVVGMDMVEVDPLFDPTQITALHAARLIFDFVGAALAK
jgi:agmatinase